MKHQFAHCCKYNAVNSLVTMTIALFRGGDKECIYIYISYISCQIFCYVTDYDSRPARVSSINVLFFSLLLFQDLQIVNSNMYMYATIFHSVHAKDETVTFDITLMNRKGSASVDSTVSSRSQFDNRYTLASHV